MRWIPTCAAFARHNTDETMREVLAYRLYSDLKRGWRITQPNLEQVGLLEIEYKSLSELAKRSRNVGRLPAGDRQLHSGTPRTCAQGACWIRFAANSPCG